MKTIKINPIVFIGRESNGDNNTGARIYKNGVLAAERVDTEEVVGFFIDDEDSCDYFDRGLGEMPMEFNDNCLCELSNYERDFAKSLLKYEGGLTDKKNMTTKEIYAAIAAAVTEAKVRKLLPWNGDLVVECDGLIETEFVPTKDGRGEYPVKTDNRDFSTICLCRYQHRSFTPGRTRLAVENVSLCGKKWAAQIAEDLLEEANGSI